MTGHCTSKNENDLDLKKRQYLSRSDWVLTRFYITVHKPTKESHSKKDYAILINLRSSKDKRRNNGGLAKAKVRWSNPEQQSRTSLQAGVRGAGGRIAGEDLTWEAPRLSGPEAHVIERLAAAPPAPNSRRAIARRRQILARRRPRAGRSDLALALARPGGGSGRRRRDRRRADQEDQHGCGRGSGSSGHLRMQLSGLRGPKGVPNAESRRPHNAGTVGK